MSYFFSLSFLTLIPTPKSLLVFYDLVKEIKSRKGTLGPSATLPKPKKVGRCRKMLRRLGCNIM